MDAFSSAPPPIGAVAGVQRMAVVGPSDDPLERQADTAAGHAVRGEAAPEVQRMVAPDVALRAPALPEVQRVAASPEVQRAVASPPEVQRAAVSTPEVQREGDGGGGGSGADGAVAAGGPSARASQAIASSGAGSPMLGSTRGRLESSFGVHLGDVRVHEGPAAAAHADALSARAFTHGNHIWLGSGERQSDVRLMAHETTHVLQQDAILRRAPAATPLVQREVRSGARGGGGARPTGRSDSGSSGSGSADSGRSATGGASARSDGGAGGAGAPGGRASGGGGAGRASSGGGSVPGRARSGGGPDGGGPLASPRVAAASSGSSLSLLMPEPPTEPSSETMARIVEVEARASAAGADARDLPGADENAASARGAVEEPSAETEGRAEAALVADLEAQAAPSPEIEQLCEDIRRVIRERRPADESALASADIEGSARDAGAALEGNVRSGTEAVESNYEGIAETPAGEPGPTPTPIEDPAASVESPDLAAGSATPDPVRPEAVSLDADVAASRDRATEAGLDRPAAALVAEQGGDASNPINEAREGQSELEETAARGPAEVLAEQTATLGRANADFEALQIRAAEALAAARSGTVADNRGRQDGMVESEAATRERVSTEAQQIFDSTRTTVLGMIEPLADHAIARWEAGVQILSTTFRQDLDEVQRWIDERHSGVGGFFVGLGDAVFGLPDWVMRRYDTAEENFGDGVCDLIREISRDVNSVILAAEALIDSANQRISSLFENLGPGLEAWAAEQRSAFAERLEGLRGQVRETQRSFTSNLRERAAHAVDEVRAEIQQLREAAGGLLGRIANAIDRFLEDPAKFIIEGLLQILGIPPASFWALLRRIGEVADQIADDPERFANNLLAALAQGFEQFFDHIGTHLLNGLLQWLFSGLGSVGVTIPRDFSLSSVITFFLQLMGITWPRIRRIIARHIGEENVALLEQAYSLISTLIERGPEGVFEMIREQLNPQTILDTILQTAIDYLVEAVITRVTARIVMMLNPAGAILQAIEAIYRVLRWIFENAARIFTLVETVVNGLADIIAGNIGGWRTLSNAPSALAEPGRSGARRHAGIGHREGAAPRDALVRNFGRGSAEYEHDPALVRSPDRRSARRRQLTGRLPRVDDTLPVPQRVVQRNRTGTRTRPERRRRRISAGSRGG